MPHYPQEKDPSIVIDDLHKAFSNMMLNLPGAIHCEPKSSSVETMRSNNLPQDGLRVNLYNVKK